MIEKLARALDEAEIGYSIRLVALVNDEATYRATINDETREFPSHGLANEWVDEVRRVAKIRAVLTALREPDEGMVEAFWQAQARATTVFADPADSFAAMIDHILQEADRD